MRPQGRGELDSLYFDYPHFEAPDPAAVASGEPAPVLIIGAGPVGMAAALTLARHGVRSVLIDNKATFNDGSRAICISRSSMYALERMGAVAPFLAKALGWTTGRGYFRGREIGRFEMPHSPHDKYLPMYNLQQQYIEQFLHDAVVRSGMIDTRWRTEMTGLIQDGDEVRVAVSTPKGGYEIRARYCLAADGARSPVRRLLGLRLKGRNLEGRYVIADVRMRHDFPTERRALFEPASNPGGTVLVHRQPDDIWRIDYQLAPDEDEAEAMAERNIRARVGAILDEIGHRGGYELEWWSVYSANTLCLDDYRSGRVFFVGDSAHIVPIFGVRGLNNGLLDAENVGWKLARVLSGCAPEALLDSYDPERRGATLDVFANASQSAAFMTPPTPGHALMRRAALSLALTEDFVRPLANPRNMTPYAYLSSPLTRPDDASESRFAGGPAPGAVCLDARLADGFLLDRAGRGYSALLFSEDATLAAEIERRGRKTDSDFALVRIGAGRDADVPDPEGEVARRFDAGDGTCYLVRPDQHVACRWKQVSAAVPAERLTPAGGGAEDGGRPETAAFLSA
jgi:3-(3-hydroxy-phenyl)propionate hydroxylase